MRNLGPLSAQYFFNLIFLHAGFAGIGNSKQCRKARGKCVKRRCPGSLKRIGNCSRKVACCRKK
uniref:Beta-defensin-like domain-containing protein n=1 Tax=Salvator merianae TaxID=96440 RepID=A0A8D0BCW4_SALMN